MKHRNYFVACLAALMLLSSLLIGCAGESGQNRSSSEPASGSVESSSPESPAGSQSTAEGSGNDYDPTATGTYEDGSTPSFSGTKLRLTVNGEEEVVIALYDNTAADALLERLPLEELSFFDLSGIEKPIQQLEEPLSLGEEEPGYAPIPGEMVIYRPWANFTIFYGDFRYSSELVPLGKVESDLEVISGQTEDFSGVLELMEE